MFDYNSKSKLTSAVLGNNDFSYDADGNATLIKTTTGTWSVSCNGENRPVRFENAATQTVVECGYDSLGRRFEKKVSVAGTQEPALKRVIYWDPTEETATRPLAISIVGDNVYFPTVDLTKNVCELVDFYGNVAATYDYAPFGNVSAASPAGTTVPANPLQWSSEIYDSELDLVYYNYRHYSPSLGRFLSRDPIEEQGGWNLYSYCENKVLDFTDSNGEIIVDQWLFPAEKTYACCGGKSYDTSASCCVDNEIHSKSEIAYTGVSYYVNRTRWYYIPIFRPWSISQFFLQHAWFNIGNGEWRAGSYPNSDIPSGINIGEEEYAKKEGDTLTFKTDIKLSVCEYDAKKFSSCVKNKAALGNNWHLWNNCLDWVYDTIDTCKNEVKRK